MTLGWSCCVPNSKFKNGFWLFSFDTKQLKMKTNELATLFTWVLRMISYWFFFMPVTKIVSIEKWSFLPTFQFKRSMIHLTTLTWENSALFFVYAILFLATFPFSASFVRVSACYVIRLLWLLLFTIHFGQQVDLFFFLVCLLCFTAFDTLQIFEFTFKWESWTRLHCTNLKHKTIVGCNYRSVCCTSLIYTWIFVSSLLLRFHSVFRHKNKWNFFHSLLLLFFFLLRCPTVRNWDP